MMAMAEHIYDGRCPTPDAPEDRDPDCDACIWLDDAQRLRDAVGEWADNVGAVHVGSPEQRLLHLARELGLVDGGAA